MSTYPNSRFTSTQEPSRLGYYVVADIKYRTVQEFDTEAEAEEFVAKSNGTDVETVRSETTQLGRMLAQYRENLFHGSRERHKN